MIWSKKNSVLREMGRAKKYILLVPFHMEPEKGIFRRVLFFWKGMIFLFPLKFQWYIMMDDLLFENPDCHDIGSYFIELAHVDASRHWTSNDHPYFAWPLPCKSKTIEMLFSMILVDSLSLQKE